MTPGTAMPSAIEGGLSTSEAKRRLDQFGPSAIPEARSMPLWLRVARQFQSPLIYILVFALLFDIGMWLYEGAIRVLDRPALESHACECYPVVKTEFERLLPKRIAT